MNNHKQAFPSPRAVAYWNGSEHRPQLAHRGCMKQTFGFERVGGLIEIRRRAWLT